MRFAFLSMLLLFCPTTVFGAEIAFLIEITHASSNVDVSPSSDVDVGDLRGGAARRYREKLLESYQSSSASSEAILEESFATPTIETIQEDSDFSSSISSTSSIVPTSSFSSSIPPPAPVSIPTVSQEELDELTLSELEAYQNEAEENLEQQHVLLEEGFSVTSISSLGSPLSSAQREAILRRTVRTVPQLTLFARAIVESNDTIRKIAVEGTRVTVTLRKEARLFGLLPISYLLELDIDGGTATPDKPWWLFLARDDADEVSLSLESGVDALDTSASQFDQVKDLLKLLFDVL